MSGSREKEIIIRDDNVKLTGILGLPGSGNSRLSPRNTFVARALQNAGFATFLFDLLEE